MMSAQILRYIGSLPRTVITTVAVGVAFAGASPAPALGENVEFENAAPLQIPAAEPCCAVTAALLYPSSIDVPGLDGIVTKVSVTLHGMTFNKLEDLAVLLTGPNGKSVVLMASYDRGRPDAPSDATWTFEDQSQSLRCSEAEGLLPSSAPAYRPINCGLLAPFPAPAPEGPYSDELHGLGNGDAGGGEWSLYVYGYSGGEGVIAGGWSLRIERHEAAILPEPPHNIVLPSISGVGLSGQILSCEQGSWVSTPPPSSFSYQWLRDGMSAVVDGRDASYVVQSVDQGQTLSCEVTASNVVGHSSVVSGGLMIAPAGPRGESNDLESVSGGADVSAARVRTMLDGWLRRSGNMARITAFLKNGAFYTSLHSLTAGTVTINWYGDHFSARRASVRSRQTLVAIGKRTFQGPSTATLKIKLTAEGERLLKHAKQVRLTAKGTFTAVGMAPITSTRRFLIKR
jgi:hypothetical protein